MALQGSPYAFQSIIGGGWPSSQVLIYNTSVANSMASGSTVVDFDTAVETTAYLTVTTGASWNAAATVAGRYLVIMSTHSDSGGGWGVGESWSNLIFVNTTLIRYAGLNRVQAANTTFINTQGSTIVELAIGDYIQPKVNNGSGGAINLLAGVPDLNFICIAYLGS